MFALTLNLNVCQTFASWCSHYFCSLMLALQWILMFALLLHLDACRWWHLPLLKYRHQGATAIEFNLHDARAHTHTHTHTQTHTHTHTLRAYTTHTVTPAFAKISAPGCHCNWVHLAWRTRAHTHTHTNKHTHTHTHTLRAYTTHTVTPAFAKISAPGCHCNWVHLAWRTRTHTHTNTHTYSHITCIHHTHSDTCLC
jgi:hypothetical protein